MLLLPGQKMINGVSNFLFGTNMGQQVGANGVLVTPAIQAQVAAGNFQIIRIGNLASKTDSFIDESLAAAQACGCQVMIVLDLNNLAANEHVLSYVGNRCNIYEFGNEPDGVAAGSLTGSQYYALWSAQVPTLRTFNPNAVFLGPVVTSAALSTSFISDWLTACDAIGGSMLPDAISFHHYPCTTTNNQTICASRSTIFSGDYSTIDGVVTGILGHSLPICVSEWNISGGSHQQSYCLDPTFAATWIHSAIDNMAIAGFALACQFEAGSGEGAGELDMISVTSPFTPGVDYQPIVDKNIHYLQSVAVLSPEASSRDGIQEATSRDGISSEVSSRDGLSPEASSRDGIQEATSRDGISPAADSTRGGS